MSRSKFTIVAVALLSLFSSQGFGAPAGVTGLTDATISENGWTTILSATMTEVDAQAAAAAGGGDYTPADPATIVSAQFSTAGGHRPRIWLSPNINSEDYRALMDYDWNSDRVVNVFKFHMANLGGAGSAMAPNNFPEFKARQGFQRLNMFGMDLALEAGVIKPPPDGNMAWCQGPVLLGEAVKYIRQIRQEGAQIKWVTLDEPLNQTSANAEHSCGLSYAETVRITADWIKGLRAQEPRVAIADIESFPAPSAAKLKKWIDDLQAAGALPSAFHIDINREVAAGDIRNPAIQNELIDLANHVRAKGVRFGIIYWGQQTTNSDAYVRDVLGFYVDSAALRAVTDDYIFQSWHPSANGKMDIPVNLDTRTSNHLSLIRSSARYDIKETKSGCATGPLSQDDYLTFYPDVRSAGINAFLHYKLFGAKEGRCEVIGRCTMPVSAADYLTLYDDVRNAGSNPIEHFNLWGKSEGRCPIQ